MPLQQNLSFCDEKGTGNVDAWYLEHDELKYNSHLIKRFLENRCLDKFQMSHPKTRSCLP